MNQAGAKPSSTGEPDAVSPIRHQHTMFQYEQLHAVSMAVSGRAQAGTLDHESALKFCTHLLPQLLVEFEIARRVEDRLATMFPAAAEPEPVLPPKSARRARKPRKGKR
jgi:hypothetical protein